MDFGTTGFLGYMGSFNIQAQEIEKPGYKKRHNCRNNFHYAGGNLPSITGNPIKSLGKWFDDSLGDTQQKFDTAAQLKMWLESIDKTSLQGLLKAWCFQFGILPRLSWPFSLYDFPLTTVEQMERTSSNFPRKRFGVPKSFSDINLYSKSSPAALPVSSVVEEFKVSKVRTTLLLQHSKDEIARGTKVRTPKNRKWSPQAAIVDAETKLKQADIVGTIAEGRKGIGNHGIIPWAKADSKQRRHMIISEVRKGEEETRNVKAIGMANHGSWMSWADMVESRRLSGNQLLQEQGSRLAFFLKAVSDTLPSSTNLALWRKLDDPTCPLCQEKAASLKHILTSCKKALSDNRYTWCHDQVLAEIAKYIRKITDNSDTATISKVGVPRIAFVKPGTKDNVPKKSKQQYVSGLLHTASDWKLQVDSKERLVFPQEVVTTTLRPDIVITSSSTKCIILVELTVPWEDRIEESHQIKGQKYDHIVTEAIQNGWQAYCFPVEVGCRVFPAKSLSWMLRSLGLPSNKCKKAIIDIGKVAERCSKWLWLKRNASWLPG